jgi:hypothetical protein
VRLHVSQQKGRVRYARALLLTIVIVLLIVRYAVQQYYRKAMAWPAEKR